MAVVSRGIDIFTTFIGTAALDTSTSIDQLVYISASNTVALVTTQTNYAVGSVESTTQESVQVNLFAPTRRLLGVGTIAAGSLVGQATGTAYVMSCPAVAATTFTTSETNRVIGVAVNATTGTAQPVEVIMLPRGSSMGL